MDRPWVNGGVKVAVIDENDCPSLLVQRVARLRSPVDKLSKFYISQISGRKFQYYIECNQQAGGGVPHIGPVDLFAKKKIQPLISLIYTDNKILMVNYYLSLYISAYQCAQWLNKSTGPIWGTPPPAC